MLPTDRPAFVAVLNGLTAVKPGANKLTPEALTIWWEALKHWPLAEFKSAASHLTTAVEFMPNPYHFEQLRKAADIGKNEAWAIALNRSTQHVEHPEDRITVAARMVGGYYHIGHTHTDQLPFLARRFMDAYEECGAKVEALQTLPNLAPPVGRLESRSAMQRLQGKAAESVA